MFPNNLHVTCVCTAPSVYRLYYLSRRVGRALAVDNDVLYVSHSFTESGRVVASLRDADGRLETIEGVIDAPLAAA